MSKSKLAEFADAGLLENCTVKSVKALNEEDEAEIADDEQLLLDISELLDSHEELLPGIEDELIECDEELLCTAIELEDNGGWLDDDV